MTTDHDTTDGVHLETFEGFAEYAAENPEAVQLGVGARSTYEGTCAHSLAKIDSYTLGGDIISEELMPESIKSDEDLRAACIGGAE